jgi:hypothetical protein
LYESDRQRLLQDERFVHNLISEDGTALIIYLKLVDAIQLEQARELVEGLNKLVQTYDFEEYHFLGRPFFQTQLVEMEIEEVSKSAVISGILVSIIFFFIFRRFRAGVECHVGIVSHSDDHRGYFRYRAFYVEIRG